SGAIVADCNCTYSNYTLFQLLHLMLTIAFVMTWSAGRPVSTMITDEFESSMTVSSSTSLECLIGRGLTLKSVVFCELSSIRLDCHLPKNLDCCFFAEGHGKGEV